MPWAVFLKNIETDKYEPMRESDKALLESPIYGYEVHIVPGFPDIVQDKFHTGVHDLNQSCNCHPKIHPHLFGRIAVIHSERVN